MVVVAASVPASALHTQTGAPHRTGNASGHVNSTAPNPDDPPEVSLGRRLFMETRFAQFFAAHCAGNVNRQLTQGDPLVAHLQTPYGPISGPYAGKSINCRTCHFVNELGSFGTRTYADFAQRTPVPDRGDGQTVTTRNSRGMVDSFVPNPVGMLLHADGEFSSKLALIKGTLTGRNLGWLPGEYRQAVAHIARVIREDDGTSTLASLYGGAYPSLFLSTAPEMPAQFRLPPSYRIDVSRATDDEVFDAVARVIGAYLDSLTYMRNTNGVHNGSPYDLFLARNGLPAVPEKGESHLQYSQRLLRAVRELRSPVWVSPSDGKFEYHYQQFVFGPRELQGLTLFLTQVEPTQPIAGSANRLRTRHLGLYAAVLTLGIMFLGYAGRRKRLSLIDCAAAVAYTLLLTCGASAFVSSVSSESGTTVAARHMGNCISCHPAPEFTDYSFHNTGATQVEYDSVHGIGAFAALFIPGYQQRQANPNAYLPASSQHPNATGIFRAPPSTNDYRLVDLGMWNVYANDDFPGPQKIMRKLMCVHLPSCKPERVLPLTIARFRTPSLRDLGQSPPYMHTGQLASIEDVLKFYQRVSTLTRDGKIRNPDPAVAEIFIDDNDAAALAAFLRSLNEDYD